jgi:hypothetical protein
LQQSSSGRSRACDHDKKHHDRERGVVQRKAVENVVHSMRDIHIFLPIKKALAGVFADRGFSPDFSSLRRALYDEAHDHHRQNDYAGDSQKQE